MIRDIFFHPAGFACSAAWFLLVVWLLLKVYRRLFPPAPPVD